jgi:hypothetical protein
MEVDLGLKLGQKHDSIRINQTRMGYDYTNDFAFSYKDKYQIKRLETWLVSGEARIAYNQLITKCTLSHGWVKGWQEKLDTTYLIAGKMPLKGSNKLKHRKKHGHTWDGSVSMGYQYQLLEQLTITPHIGYAFDSIKLKHRVLSKRHEIDKQGPFIGLDLHLKTSDTLSVRVANEYHFLTHFKNSFVTQGNIPRYLNELETYDMKLTSRGGSNYAILNKLELSYQVDPLFEINMGIFHRYAKNKLNKLKGHSVSPDDVRYNKIKSGKHQHRSWGFHLGASYRF